MSLLDLAGFVLLLLVVGGLVGMGLGTAYALLMGWEERRDARRRNP